MRAVVAALAVLAGCFNPTPQPGAPCNSNGDCPRGLECSPDNKCEKPGGMIDADIPMIDACTTGVCEGDMLVGCAEAPINCANGCGGPVPHCRRMVPSNNITVGLLNGATADINLDKLNFDATDGSIRRMNVDIREGGNGVISGIRFEVVQGIAVWVANTWTLPANESWSFSGTTPVTLYANLSISILGNIDVGPSTLSPSVGIVGGSNANGSTTIGGCRGRAGRSLDATHGEGGGGGGGAGQAGANGGTSNTQQGTFTGIGGNCTTNPSTIPLAGGNGGGHGANSTANVGGAGGGAIALVAMDTITISGDVGAPGAGGVSGASGNGGGGGGGGGAILIEAPNVNLTGRLTANGGAGGAPSGGADGGRGSTTSNAFAVGGSFMGASGGRGATSMGAPGVGTSYNQNVTDPVTMVTTNTNRGAGGGGGVGKIEVKRRAGGVSGLASPAAVISDAVFE